MVVINDGGELKSVSGEEFSAELHTHIRSGLRIHADHDTQAQAEDNILVYEVLNKILDERAIAEGTYDPSDNDIPVEVMMGGE